MAVRSLMSAGLARGVGGRVACARVVPAACVAAPRTLLSARFGTSGADGRDVVDNSTLVPKISLKPFLEGSDADRLAVAKELDHAATNVGFFGIVDHGFPADVMDRAWTDIRDFFDLDEEEKSKLVSNNQDEYPYGYVPFGGEVLSGGRSLEEGKVDAMTPDLKECMSLGPYNPASGAPAPIFPANPATFEQSWLDYYKAMETLSGTMLHVFALALDLPQTYFDDKVTKHRSALRALNYPELDTVPEPGQLRASAHSDYGSMTILKPDDAPGGLQVLGKDDKWHTVPYDPDMFVINLGDLMARWTNDRWKSTLHRVVVPPQNINQPTRRQSVAFFHNINADEVVSTLETCKSAENPDKYEPIVSFDFLMMKHKASMM